MKYSVLLSGLFGLLVAVSAQAQHAGDILFDYQAGQIVITPSPYGMVFTGAFNPADPGNGLPLPYTFEPGIDTVGGVLGSPNVTPGNTMGYLILGPVLYHDGTALALSPADLLVAHGTDVIIVTNTSGAQFDFDIGAVADVGGAGAFHQHLAFALSSPTAPVGAYGILFQFAAINNIDVQPADPFWLVFNWGLGASEFEAAVQTFAVPEASSLCLMAVGSLAMGLTLRRRIK